MKEKIENKVNEIINYILSKTPDTITYNEYRILDGKLASIRYEEEQRIRNKDWAEVMGKIVGNGINEVNLNKSL